MYKSHNIPKRKAAFMTVAATIVWIFASTVPAFSHGGKMHGDIAFSALQAVQKATQLYDRLIHMQKLTEEWEVGLTSIHVSTRQVEKRREIVVQFKRAEGEPGSVYFFFDGKGEYSGSNFTGQ